MQKQGPPPPGFAPPPGGYGPPPGAFAPPPPYPDGQPLSTGVVIMQPTVFGKEPQRMNCPQCGANISTSIKTGANTKTHLFALLLCVLGLWCCAPCPYCIDSCLVTQHYCPACQAFLGQSDN